mgnify:CR=1 FL=1
MFCCFLFNDTATTETDPSSLAGGVRGVEETGPDTDPLAWLQAERSAAGQGRKAPATVLAGLLPKALAGHLVDATGLEGTLADQSDDSLGRLAKRISGWSVTPSGTEGYRTAEVTAGGICTDALDARSPQSRAVPGPFAIGEAVDVPGRVGG